MITKKLAEWKSRFFNSDKSNDKDVAKPCFEVEAKETPFQESSNSKKVNLSDKFKIETLYGSQGYKKVISWIVKNLIPANSSGVVFGRSQSFKTFFLVYLACHIATGRAFAGLAIRKGLVIFIAAEGEQGLAKRVRAWEILNECEVGRSLVIIPHSVFPTEPEQKKCLIDKIIEESKFQGLPVALTIFDTMSKCSNGAYENDAGAMTKYLNDCKMIGRAVGCSVINVHHTRRVSDDFRGAQSIQDSVDFMLSVKRNTKAITKRTTISLNKMKESEIDFEWHVDLKPLDIDAMDDEKNYINTLCVTDIRCNKSQAGEKDEIDEGKMDFANLIVEQLTEKPCAPTPFKELRQQLSDKLGVPNNKTFAAQLSRANKKLVREGEVIQTKKGREVHLSLKQFDDAA